MELSMKEMKIQIKELKRKAIDVSKWETWNENDILMWIMSLDDGRYKRYESALEKSLKEQELKGEDLELMNNVSDIAALGITAFGDKKRLLNSIEKLKNITNNNDNNDNTNNKNNNFAATEGSNAPTAYIR